jgi:signal transduction histidine kinase
MVFFTFLFMLASRNIFVWMLPVLFEGIIIFWYFNENNKTFEKINQGFQASLKEQMKSERMKVDLITNVSHDLKTPLTSIISYVDLLSKEDLPESARDYVSILAEKSGRLKNIVSDLFDLAKSTSGNLPLDMERIDIRRLIEQTLGDMEDDIEKSGIRIKTTLTDVPIYIYSDGKKLYRVFQNIIGNALKYSLQGTRVFIDMDVEDNIVNITVKNTASYDMDFTAEDVLQRFSRGDKSRSTEGSGLGLSIAESFTWACGGSFKVEIDGDQFKVKLGFPVVG